MHSNLLVDKESIYIEDLNHFRKNGEFIESHKITEDVSKPKISFKPDQKFRVRR